MTGVDCSTSKNNENAAQLKKLFGQSHFECEMIAVGFELFIDAFVTNPEDNGKKSNRIEYEESLQF